MDMNGKLVHYTPHLTFYLRTPRNKFTFAIDLSSGMMLACLRAPYAGPWYWGGSTKIGKMIGASCLIVVGIFITPSPFFGSIFCVLLIPCFGRFMWPFAVAGLGFKYFTTSY